MTSVFPPRGPGQDRLLSPSRAAKTRAFEEYA
jgi:hypothetical protein